LSKSDRSYESVTINNNGCVILEQTHIATLTFVTNLSLSTGKFPENLKIPKIKPLKKGSANEVENNKQISLLSTFSKIFEKVVCTLINFLGKHNILLESQHGFRKGSTSFVNLLKDVCETPENKDVCVGLFLDLSKHLTW
jgi:hypothetical protein